MAERKLDALETRVAAGGTVRFGAVEARADGLVVATAGVGGQYLPWAEVGAIEAEGGALVLHDKAGQAWGRAALGDVPNAFLLVELAERRAAKTSSTAS
jgi:hypothetical protein